MHLPIPQYEAQLARLQEREELKFGSADAVGVDLQDVSSLVAVGVFLFANNLLFMLISEAVDQLVCLMSLFLHVSLITFCPPCEHAVF